MGRWQKCNADMFSIQGETNLAEIGKFSNNAVQTKIS